MTLRLPLPPAERTEAADGRRIAARLAMRGALLGFWIAPWQADDIVRNVAHPIENGEDVYETLRHSQTFAKHIAPDAADEAVSLAGNAWLRAMGEEPRRLIAAQRIALSVPQARSQLERVVDQVRAGVPIRDAAKDTRDGGNA